jgi:hypothetical protein
MIDIRIIKLSDVPTAGGPTATPHPTSTSNQTSVIAQAAATIACHATSTTTILKIFTSTIVQTARGTILESAVPVASHHDQRLTSDSLTTAPGPHPHGPRHDCLPSHPPSRRLPHFIWARDHPMDDPQRWTGPPQATRVTVSMTSLRSE